MDRETHKAELAKLCTQKPKDNLSKQKFKRGQKVHVCKDMPECMSHFESDFDAIIEYTYAQQYGGDDIKNYSLIVLNETGEAINSIAWYDESQLTLIDSDTIKGKSIIDEYNHGE